MKIKNGFVLKTIAGNTVAVPAGQGLVDLQVMLTLNESGTYLWNCLKEEQSETSLVQALLGEYQIDEATALADVREFVAVLKENQLLDETGN